MDSLDVLVNGVIPIASVAVGLDVPVTVAQMRRRLDGCSQRDKLI